MALMLSKKKSGIVFPPMPTVNNSGSLVSGQTTLLAGEFCAIDPSVSKIYYKGVGSLNSVTIHVYFIKDDGTYSSETVTGAVGTTEFRNTAISVPSGAIGVGLYFSGSLSDSITYYFE